MPPVDSVKEVRQDETREKSDEAPRSGGEHQLQLLTRAKVRITNKEVIRVKLVKKAIKRREAVANTNCNC
ncbi:hypothetical protein EV586_10551 [Tumebacillus sp. BK434]|uniref:hypothetical protein n=1 Tax=Tumebacillus sp. BK434 TaxID=2512169 RepID=UPI0010523583|nr:hypothetical protein [Tumebacillus sp. BK434]TCP53707.1 hypothetical protein EV586_10551 [Tumebacillus sp. BK434]